MCHKISCDQKNRKVKVYIGYVSTSGGYFIVEGFDGSLNVLLIIEFVQVVDLFQIFLM